MYNRGSTHVFQVAGAVNILNVGKLQLSIIYAE